MFILPRNSRARARRRARDHLLKTLCVLLSCCLAACAVGPDFVRPEAPATRHYTYEEEPSGTIAAEGGTQRFERGAKIAADWWRLFNCSKLDAVIMQSVANNPTLQAAQASLRQSEDNLRAGYGIFYPQLGASFQPARQQFSPARFGESTGPSIFNLYTFSTTAAVHVADWHVVMQSGAWAPHDRCLEMPCLLDRAEHSNVPGALTAKLSMSLKHSAKSK